MAGPTTAVLDDRCNDLEKRVGQVEVKMEGVRTTVDSLTEFRKTAEPNVWYVTHARGLFVFLFGVAVTALGTALYGGYSFLQRFNRIEFASEDHAKRIEDQARDQTRRLGEQGARQEKRLDEQAQRIKELTEANNRLRTYVTVINERTGKGLPMIPEALVWHGKILRVDPKELKLLPDEFGEPARLFSLTDSPRITLNGKPARAQELEPNMRASVVTSAGEVTDVHAKTPPK
jgi:hypothetical protein